MTFRTPKIAAICAAFCLGGVGLATADNEPAINLSKAANLVAQQDFAEAISVYTRILENDAASAVDRGAAFYNRGIAEQEIGMTGHAIADFTQAIWLGHLDNKQLATAHFRRGKGYALLKQYSRAITDFDRAIQLEPAFAQAYSERGDAYRHRGIYKLALQDYGTSIRLLNPELHVPYYGRGLTHEAMGNDRLAYADFRRAAELNPEFKLATARLLDVPGVQLASAGSEPAAPVSATGPSAAMPVDAGPVLQTPEPVETAHVSDTPEAMGALEASEEVASAAANSVAAPANLTSQSETKLEEQEVASTLPAEQDADAGQARHTAMEEMPPQVVSAATNELQADLDADEQKVAEPSVASNVAATEKSTEPAPAVAGLPSGEPQQTASVSPVEEEATGAIPSEDRDVSATTLREEQRVAALAAPQNTQQKPAAAPEATPEANTGKFLVQIASYKEKDDALRRFDKLSGLHSDLLSGLSPDILRADLGERGVFYRLRIGPFQTFQGSADLCNQLKQRNLDCLVIQRKGAG